MSKLFKVVTMLIFLLGVVPQVVNGEEKPKVIYYVPHQDDEVVSMGVSILNHVKSGQEVHLVLTTNGTGSYMLKKMNMSAHNFQKARNTEFINSAKALGVKESNIHFENLQDGKVTKQQMRDVITKYEKMFPNAKHKSYTYYDKHNDHRVSGEALNELYNEGLVSDARFYVNYGRYDTKGRTTLLKYGGEVELRRAARFYYVENKALGLHGIGYKSAGHRIFSNAINNPKNIYHLPNE